MGKVIVRRKRDFHPHHKLLHGARIMLKDAETVESGCFYYQLSAMMLSAFALEAMANSFGNCLFVKWNDWRPIKNKVQMVAKELNENIDMTKEPYSTAFELIDLRNKVAHAKYERIDKSDLMSYDESLKAIKEPPLSKLESNISFANIQKSVQAVDDIFDRWLESLPDDRKGKLYGDGWFAKVSPASDENL